MIAASFPSSIWDGGSASRPAPAGGGNVKTIYREPDGGDYGRVVAELVATQTALNRVRILNAAANTAAVALAATAGHGYMPTCAGTPTGVPGTVAGFAGFLYDTTAHKLWVYDAGWKATSALS